jgi:L,D-transpeptidase ErfK/SrfK
MKFILYIISTLFIFGHSSIALSWQTNFLWVAHNEEVTNSPVSSENKSPDNVYIKWSDENIVQNDDNSRNNEQESNVNINSNNIIAWFNKTEEPSIFKTHDIKTNFNKNDPYYGKHLCGDGIYTCISLKKNDTWHSLFPNKYQRELVQRINRTNKGLWNRNWILVPNDINSNYMDFTPLPKSWNTNGQKTIIINISELAFGAYDHDGDLLHWGPINPGKDSSKTVRGDNFKIYRKGGADCWSKKYEAYMPYCMFFHEGYAMHGFSMPGYAASHGCVRMYVDDALWLNKNFADYKTKVIVQD